MPINRRSRRSASSASRRCTRRKAASVRFQPYMRPIYAGARIGGSAITVLLHPGDNWMMHVAVELARPGDIVVAAVSSA